MNDSEDLNPTDPADDAADADEQGTSPNENDGEQRYTKAEMLELAEKMATEKSKELTSKAVEKRLRRERRKSKSETKQESPPSEDIRAIRRELDLRDALDNLKTVTLTARQRRTVLREMAEEGVTASELGSWLPEALEDLGFANLTQSDPSNDSKVNNDKPQTRTTAKAVAPATTRRSYDHRDNPIEWDDREIAEVLADKGPKEGGKWLLKRFLEYMDGVTVTK